MAIPYPDILVHNNVNDALIDSTFVRGGKRFVADLTALYALSPKFDQLQKNVSIVYIDSLGLDYLLIDDTNIGNSSGWQVYWNQGYSVYDSRYAMADGSGFNWSAGYSTYDARYLQITGGTLTGPLILAGAPTTAMEAANKAYVDAFLQGLQYKNKADVATTANITLLGEQTIDGVLTSASRVLVWQQTDPKQNGVYTSGAGAWTRTADTDTGDELLGATLLVRLGTVNANLLFTCNTSAPIVIGSSDITFIDITPAITYINGAGLDLTGNVFSITTNGVTYGMIQQVAANALFGNPTGSTANGQEIGIGVGLDFSSGNLVNTITDTNDLTNGAGFISASTGFIQNGNTFGASARLGTNDAHDLEFEVNNVKKATLRNSDGNLELVNGLVIPVSSSGAGVIWQVNNSLVHTFGVDSLFVGSAAGNFTHTSTTVGNVGIGPNSMVALTTGQQNTAVGAYTLNGSTTPSGLTAMGYGALFSNTTGTFNNAFGSTAMQFNTTGVNNCAFGSSGLKANTTGGNNMAFGGSALLSNTTGNSSVAFGTSAGRFGTIGNHNFWLGENCGRNNVSGSSNVGIGYQALQGVSGNSFNNNIAIGDQSGNGVTTGSNNVLIGHNNGFSLTTGSNNVLIGYSLALPSGTSSNFLSIGNIIFATGVNGTGTTISSANVGIAIAAPSFLFSVKDEFYYDGNAAAGLLKSVNNPLAFIVQNTDVGGLSRGLISVYNDDANGLDLTTTSTVFTTSGNVLQHDRSIITSGAADGLHIWNSIVGKTINFWLGSLSSEVSVFELSDTVANVKVALATKTQVISATVSLPDGISTFIVNNGLNNFTMPPNPVDGQLAEFIANNSSSGYTLIANSGQAFRQQGLSAGTTYPIGSAGISSEWKWVASLSAWLRKY